MFFSMEQIYLLVGLLVLGLADLYLYRYPLFHPIVLLPAAGWLWGDMSAGLVVGGILELIFGLAQIKESRKLNMILYAGGLGLFINQVTYNISLPLSLTLGMVLTLGVQVALDKVREWQKWVLLLIISGLIVVILPFGKEMFGWIPAQLLNQMAIGSVVLTWVFFAYAVVGSVGRTRDKTIELSIPAVIVGSILAMKSFIWGPMIFIFAIYLLDALLKDRDWAFLRWVNVALLVLGAYLLLPNLLPMTLWVFGGLLVFNILLVLRGFAPIEIYFLLFIMGIILSRAGLLV